MYYLYIFDNDTGKHSGKVHFEDLKTAMHATFAAFRTGIKQIMLTDAMDLCVIDIKDGKVLHPDSEMIHPSWKGE